MYETAIAFGTKVAPSLKTSVNKTNKSIKSIGNQAKAAAELVRELMREYKMPVENVIRHYAVAWKTCPTPFVLDSEKWLSFKVTLAGAEKTKSEGINDFVWELAERKIITNMALWLKKTAEDINCFWLIKWLLTI